MLHASELFREMKSGEEFGIFAKELCFDYGRMLSYRQDVVDKLCGGVEQLFKANGVSYIKGSAVLEKDSSVSVTEEGEKKSFRAKHVLLAACAPRPGPGLSDWPGLSRSVRPPWPRTPEERAPGHPQRQVVSYFARFCLSLYEGPTRVHKGPRFPSPSQISTPSENDDRMHTSPP